MHIGAVLILVLFSRHSEADIAKQVNEMRSRLMEEGRANVPLRSTPWETHQLAEASERKNQQLRAAFGIRDDYVDGSSFDVLNQADKTAQAKAKAEKEQKIE